MVLTRRTAAARAAEEAVQPATSTSSTNPHTPPLAASTNDDSSSTARHAPFVPQPASSNPSASNSESSNPETTPEKLLDPGIRTSIASRLAIGHLSALIAVLTVTHAASLPASSSLPWHALLLLSCTVPLRCALALLAHSAQEPSKQSGMVLALAAPVLFASNALHVLATRTDSSQLLLLIACAAVDICASWLRMTVTAREAVKEPFAILVAVGYSAADIFLAAVVAKQMAVRRLFQPFLIMRLVLNFRVMILSARDIVRREGKTR